jgi:hypothetical protein
LIPAGQFTRESTWQSHVADVLTTAAPSVAADTDRFINSLGINARDLVTLKREECARIRQQFLRRLIAQADTYLNGSGIGSIYQNRHGGLVRTYAWSRDLHQRLTRVRQPDIQQCARWTAGLRDELHRWLEVLVGSLDGIDQPDQSPLIQITLNNYQHQRREIEAIRTSPVRQSLLNDQLDLPFYQQAIYDATRPTTEQERGPMARMLRRVGWWCQGPEADQAGSDWKVQLLILPVGYEDLPGTTLQNYAYHYSATQHILQEIHALTRIFSREVIGRGINRNPVTASLSRQNTRRVKTMALPRLTYQDQETAAIVGQLRGQMYVTVAPDSTDSAFVQSIRDVSTELSIFDCATTDPYACRVLRIIYPIPLRTTSAYNPEAWIEYYSSRQLHVFPAEQYAVSLEETRALKDKRIRLSADLVRLFTSEDHNLAELFGLCWIYGLLQAQSSGQYCLNLADGQQPDPLITGEATSIWEALGDLVAYKHQHDRLAPLHRMRRSQVVQRIQAALQRERTAIGDRSRRSAYLDQFRQDQLQPLHATNLPTVARDLAYFMDVLIEHERR